MLKDRRNRIYTYGLTFMVVYLYAYIIVLSLSSRPTPTAFPEHLEEIRQMPTMVLWVISHLSRFIKYFSIPTYALAIRLYPEPYYSECMYIPFTCAIQWFGWGCLFGWWSSRIRDFKTGSTSSSN